MGSAVQPDAKGTGEQVEQACSSGNFKRAVAEHVAASDGKPALRSSDEALKAQDEKQLVLKRILAAHEAFFDVHRDYEFAGRSFPGFAEFHSFGEQYVLVKRAKLWEANSHEYLFFTYAETFDEAQLDKWVRFMKERGLEKVTSEPNHMSSGLALVVIADNCTEGGPEGSVSKELRSRVSRLGGSSRDRSRPFNSLRLCERCWEAGGFND